MKIFKMFKMGQTEMFLSNFIVNNSKACIVFFATLMIGLMIGLTFLEKDFSHEMWFRKSDPFLIKFKEFKKTFGSDDMAIMAVYAKKGVFNPETVKLVNELTDKMWQVPKIMRVESLANFKWVRAIGDEIIISDFLPADLTPDEIEKRQKVASAMEPIKQYIISNDLKTFVIYAWPEPHFDQKPEYGPTVTAMEDMIKQYKDHPDYEFHIAGTVAMGDGLNTITMSDLKLIVPLLLITIAIMLVIIFRSFLGVIMPIGLIFTTIGSTLGFAGWAGIKLNVTTAMIPNILMAVCLADSIHMILTFIHYRQDGCAPRQALLNALLKNIKATILTSVTTAVGFYSLMYTELLPIRDMGLLAGSGTLLAWFYTLLFICPLLLYLPFKIPQKRQQFKLKFLGEIFNPKRATRLINKNKVGIIVFCFGLTIVSTYLGFNNEVNSSTIDSFRDSVPIKKAYTFMREHIGGSYGVEIVFDSGKDDGIKDPVFLNKVDAFQKWLKESKYITKASSIVDVIKDVNKALNANDDQFYKIPDKANAVAEQIMLYSMGLPSGVGLNHWSSLDNRYMRVMVVWTLIGSKASIQEINRIQANFERFGLTGHVAGTTALVAGMDGYIVSTFVSSMLMAILLVSILMAIFFKSIKLGILSMIPNVMPPLIGAGFMTLAGIHIDVGTILITSVCLGIAVDDTIYFLANYNRLTRSGISSYDAVFDIFQNTGSALIWTTVTLVVGFGCFLFGSFIPNVHFGVMTAIILGFALILDLVLTPAILLLKDNRKK
ncbi:MAG: hypothetical protein A2381_06595 [Bdellovibrionales bacterium RIFOXYB1_FULL_37_110]|nr:MAG: hypothetical protein A2181_08615 [Bdellovibrionales bacterium RIFOXYA1_FULL_38_20]OFZ50210.1 MAG: hypothetical protein A2417_19445 [Bdellovibrionales bacterium RIFOXYC1_FULL_37_79]OFZ57647.1 MAG: hypothetical protein A2381_06595 [Bdellovibrionales bacterium RIFOXYB1_FULL_37_110]OFZ61414.1 MAG: hypothetical protein A2577_00960 [Bdellovibrionales bacterium RIFOXYD1_FULL_36_51]